MIIQSVDLRFLFTLSLCATKKVCKENACDDSHGAPHQCVAPDHRPPPPSHATPLDAVIAITTFVY